MALRDQERAKFALEKIDAVKKGAAGTDETKEPKPEVEICRWFESWLSRPGVKIYEPGRLIERIAAGSPERYRDASSEARALAVWLKRFAEAFLKEGS